ncbi:hypothetical protein GDO78_021549 [Eleutherodactylus coqui]|uniref:Uncharacterized protein n=1 Tax=Eleutherodactylus coqui TaxID=57060 RepID=A0A8J6E5C8_ELECQ|nr:hypothetical protein GDO78_021549 [Eleutherodactylus coqui]
MALSDGNLKTIKHGNEVDETKTGKGRGRGKEKKNTAKIKTSANIQRCERPGRSVMLHLDIHSCDRIGQSVQHRGLRLDWSSIKLLGLVVSYTHISHLDHE